MDKDADEDHEKDQNKHDMTWEEYLFVNLELADSHNSV